MSQDDTQLMPDQNDDKAYFAPVPVQESVESLSSAYEGVPPTDADIEGQLALRNLEKRRRAKKRKRRIKILLACMLVGGIAAVVASRYFLPKEEPEIDAEPVIEVAERRGFQNVVSSSGALKAGSTVVVSPEVDGVIESIRVAKGQKVEVGDVLFTLKNEELDRAVREAQQEVATAEQSVSKAQEAVNRANNDRDKEWSDYYDKFNKADIEHSQWLQQKHAYDEAALTYESDRAAWEEAVAEAEELKVPEPVAPAEPKEVADPGLEGSEEAKRQYEEYLSLLEAYQTKYTDYLEKLNAWEAYQEMLAQVPEEPTLPEAPGEEPEYPESPNDESLLAAISDAQDGVSDAQQSLNKANETYQQALENAEKRTVKATAAGSVVAINGKVGESVGAGLGAEGSVSGGVVQISDINQMAVDIEVNEIDILSLKTGQAAEVSFSAVPDVTVKAVVSEVATVASGSGEDYGGGIVTFHVGLVIPNPDPSLRPGMTATVDIYTVDIKDALVIPAMALIEDENGASVEVVIEEDPLETEARMVKVGERNNSEVVIEDGLEEGEMVLVSGGYSGGGGDEFGDMGGGELSTTDFEG